MALPTWGAAGTQLTGGSSTSAAVPVPAGVTAGQIVLVFFYVESGQTITPPAGFAHAPFSPIIVTGTNGHHLVIFWKRAAAADSGTYAFTVAAGLVWRFAIACRVPGVVTSGSPFDVAAASAKTTTTNGTTNPLSLISNGPDRLWVWVATSFVTNTCTPPATTTERIDVSDQCAIDVATKDQAIAASSGSLSGTFANATATAAFLAALLPLNPSNGKFFAAF